MTDDVELLKARAEADALGIEYHHKAKASTIYQMISEQHTREVLEEAKAEIDVSIPPSMTEVKVNVHDNSRSDIMAAVQSLIDNKAGFVADVNEDNWHFKFRGKEDSGNNKIPLRVIKMKAQSVAQGGFAAPAIKDGKSTILMA